MPVMAQWLKNMGHKASHVKMLRPLYDAQLGTIHSPLSFDSFPHDLWGADAGRGRWFASGQIDINGNRIALDTEHWLIGTDSQSTPHFSKLHSFEFLMELKALGGDIGRRAARYVADQWLDSFDRYHHIVWDPSLTAHRLVNWLKAYPFCFEQADDAFVQKLHNSFYRQYNHLVYSLEHDDDLDIYGRIDSLYALIMLSAHIPGFQSDDKVIETYLSQLKALHDEAGFVEGGLKDRNPENLLHYLQQLISIRQSLTQSQTKIPLWLGKTIENQAKVINALIHTDKALASFQGGTLGEKDLPEKVLKMSGARIRKSDLSFEELGYTSLRKSRTSLIIDHGYQAGEASCKSPFAFELCYGNHRIITNCGPHLADEEWQQSLTSIAAHSALSIGGEDPDPMGLRSIKTQQDSMNGAALFSGTHTGYKFGFGITHTRRIYLDPHGEDCRGEDLLIRNDNNQTVSVTLRFHLHPLVKVSPIRGGSAVLIRLSSGTGWMFEADNAYLTIEPSVYLADDGLNIRKSSQIVLTTDMTDLNHQVKWAIRTTNER